MQWAVAAAPILAVALNCMAYLLLRRAGGASLNISILSGLVLGLLAMTVLVRVGLSHVSVDPWELAISQIGTYLALSFCFWAFLNLNITSLRFRILRELLDAGGSLPLPELLSSYSEEERLRRRLLRLTDGGQIVLIDGSWQIRSRGLLYLARGFDLARSVMGLGDRGAGRGG
jgi:hypothetical protein